MLVLRLGGKAVPEGREACECGVHSGPATVGGYHLGQALRGRMKNQQRTCVTPMWGSFVESTVRRELESGLPGASTTVGESEEG